MAKTIEEANKALVLEAFDTLFNKRRPVSHHLKELERAGLIEVLRNGKFMTRRLARLFGVPQAALTERASQESRSLYVRQLSKCQNVCVKSAALSPRVKERK